MAVRTAKASVWIEYVRDWIEKRIVWTESLASWTAKVFSSV
ncbi:hypothetical protein [Halalkalibacter okhensis]|nr:hypothetical protein [Halalkalibacter okhensis]